MALLAILAGVIFLPNSARADEPCPASPQTGNYLDWGDSGFSTVYYGVRGYIAYYDANLCGSDATSNGTTVTWTMITALSPTYPNDSSAQAWAQSGYFDGGPGGEDNGLYPHGLSGEVIGYFAQYTNSCKTEKTCGSGPQWTTKIVAASWAGGTSYAFTSKYVPLDQSVNMYANGTLVLYTDYDPTLSWGPSWQAQFAGETYEEESDVLGSTTTKDIYSNLEYVDAAGSFHPFASLRAETPYSSRYRNAVFTDGSGNPAYDTWTP